MISFKYGMEIYKMEETLIIGENGEKIKKRQEVV